MVQPSDLIFSLPIICHLGLCKAFTQILLVKIHNSPTFIINLVNNTFNEVIDNLCEKLIRRHPYVFQDKRPHTLEEQRDAYFKIKEFEKSK